MDVEDLDESVYLPFKRFHCELKKKNDICGHFAHIYGFFNGLVFGFYRVRACLHVHSALFLRAALMLNITLSPRRRFQSS